MLARRLDLRSDLRPLRDSRDAERAFVGNARGVRRHSPLPRRASPRRWAPLRRDRRCRRPARDRAGRRAAACAHRGNAHRALHRTQRLDRHPGAPPRAAIAVPGGGRGHRVRRRERLAEPAARPRVATHGVRAGAAAWPRARLAALDRGMDSRAIEARASRIRGNQRAPRACRRRGRNHGRVDRHGLGDRCPRGRRIDALGGDASPQHRAGGAALGAPRGRSRRREVGWLGGAVDARGARPWRRRGRLSRDRRLVPSGGALAHPRDLGLQPRGARLGRGHGRAPRQQRRARACRRRRHRGAACALRHGACRERHQVGAHVDRRRVRCVHGARVERRCCAGDGGHRDADDEPVGRHERWVSAQLRVRAGAAPPCANGRMEVVAMDPRGRCIAPTARLGRARRNGALARARGGSRRVPREHPDRALSLRDTPAVRRAPDTDLFSACDRDPRRRVSQGGGRRAARGVVARCNLGARTRALAARMGAGRNGRSCDRARGWFSRAGGDPLGRCDRHARRDGGRTARLGATRSDCLRCDRRVRVPSRGGLDELRDGVERRGGRRERRTRACRCDRASTHDVRRRRRKRVRHRGGWRARVLRRGFKQPRQRRRARAAAMGDRARRSRRCDRGVASRHRSLQCGRRPHPPFGCRVDVCP